MRRCASGLLAVVSLLVVDACGAAVRERAKPMGQIPHVVTKAEPEWLPFAIRAGISKSGDPRETHLTELRLLTTDEDVARAAWSPDGRKLVVEAKKGDDAHSQVYVIDLGTGETSRASQPSVDSSWPSFASPDDRRVLFAEEEGSRRRVVSTDSAGGDVREIVGADASDPAVVADGSAIFFVRTEGQSRDLFVQAGMTPSTPALRWLSDAVHTESTPVSSPDRTRLAWIAKKTSQATLMTARVAGTDTLARSVEALSADAESIRTPAFLPDSHRLAFASDRDDSAFQIYVVDLDERFGPGAPARSTRLTFADGGSEAPAFSNDGRHVAFVSRRDHRSPSARQLYVARWVEDP